MTKTISVHPFPARMAPELAIKHLPERKNLIILDPMMGSGTIPILASQAEHSSIGFDIDPLAVSIAQAWGRDLQDEKYLQAASRVTKRSRRYRSVIRFDKETKDFVDFWFDSKTQIHLSGLVKAIQKESASLRPALWCAFSRLIITKDAGASKARDVSHSRPHRVRKAASFDPRAKYFDSAKKVLARHNALGESRPQKRDLVLRQGDARRLPLQSNSVDCVITSPPYLQAIDYMRGHKLALVWMGYAISDLRKLRSTSIGSARGLSSEAYERVEKKAVSKRLDDSSRKILIRYIDDLDKVFKEINRVIRPKSQITFVVAEATINGNQIKVSKIISALAERNNWDLKSRTIRPIESNRRYLPPPQKGTSTMRLRMKEEVCISFLTP